MLSRSSFKAELIVYRSNLKPPRKPGDPGPLGVGNRNSADLQLLAAWIEDPRADDTWRELKKLRPDIDPAAFIKTVLRARRSAQASVNRVYGAEIGSYPKRFAGFNEASAYALQAIKENMKLTIDALPSAPLEVADFLDGAADFLEEQAQYIRNLHEFYCGYSDHLGLPDGPKFELSRKSMNRKKSKPDSRVEAVTRVRRLFMQIMSKWLSTRCGRWMDDEVASLTEIAFPGPQLFASDVASVRKIRTKANR
jgi:hypothetical protein